MKVWFGEQSSPLEDQKHFFNLMLGMVWADVVCGVGFGPTIDNASRLRPKSPDRVASARSTCVEGVAQPGQYSAFPIWRSDNRILRGVGGRGRPFRLVAR